MISIRRGTAAEIAVLFEYDRRTVRRWINRDNAKGDAGHRVPLQHAFATAGLRTEVVEGCLGGFNSLLEWATPAMLRVATAADAPAIARVHVASWRTTYPGMLPDSYLSAMDVQDYTSRWARALSNPVSPGAVTVVDEDGDVVGFASCGRQRDGRQPYEGELYAIYLLQEVQGRGYGRALVEASATRLAGQRITSMVVWVLRDNAHARGFYERLGGAYLRKRELDFGFGVTAMEVSYLWADTLATLLKRTAPAG